MKVFEVKSIPLKDVIISLANSFEVPYHHDCDEYSLEIPEHLGKGQIKGINFENGLALLIYKVKFKTTVRLEFTLDEIHPVKFINSVQGPMVHEFYNEGIQHTIDEYKCAIVASERKNGHIIEFCKDIMHEVISVEIERKTFTTKQACELEKWNSQLQKVLTDVKGINQFYHVENCGVFFKDILEDANNYQDFTIARKLNLQSITMQLFINQLAQFDDDKLKSRNRSILRIPELKKVEEYSMYIKENITKDLSIKNLSRESGLNPNKLQSGFKYLFNTSINQFIINIRLDQAKTLLKNKELSIISIAEEVGLESTSYFSKIFKKKYGITPKKYQKLHI